jgi:hypothetical protein
MKDLFKKIVVLASCFVLVGAIAGPSQSASALFENAKNDACAGVALSEGTTECPDNSGRVSGVLKTGINMFSIIIGIIAVIMIIISGLRYITSAGDSNSVNGAKNTLLYALIGLVIVALAQIIVQFVLGKTT